MYHSAIKQLGSSALAVKDPEILAKLVSNGDQLAYKLFDWPNSKWDLLRFALEQGIGQLINASIDAENFHDHIEGLLQNHFFDIFSTEVPNFYILSKCDWFVNNKRYHMMLNKIVKMSIGSIVTLDQDINQDQFQATLTTILENQKKYSENPHDLFIIFEKHLKNFDEFIRRGWFDDFEPWHLMIAKVIEMNKTHVIKPSDWYVTKEHFITCLQIICHQ